MKKVNFRGTRWFGSYKKNFLKRISISRCIMTEYWLRHWVGIYLTNITSMYQNNVCEQKCLFANTTQVYTGEYFSCELSTCQGCTLAVFLSSMNIIKKLFMWMSEILRLKVLETIYKISFRHTQFHFLGSRYIVMDGSYSRNSLNRCSLI